MPRQFQKKPLHWAKAPNNVRQNLGTEEELIALGNSYKKRPIHPLIAKQDGTMVDGWRRVNALLQIGETEAEFLVTDENLRPEEIVQIGLVSAMHRQALSDAEIYQGCKRLMQLYPHWLRKDLAVALDLDPPMVTKILSVDDLIVQAQKAFLAGKFGFSVAYPISKLPAEEQLAALTAKLNGGTRDELVRQVKRVRNGNKPTVKASRIRIELASGVTVTLAAKGSSLDLDQAIEAASEAHKLMKHGQQQGLTAKTIQKVSADRAARAGS
jgi:hypothetical protein